MKKNIMVVDDNADITLAVEQGFEDLNAEYAVVSADSGEKCFQHLKNNQLPDLILLDIMMPGMSGWEVFDKLKENKDWKNIPIVFLTARTDRVAVNAGQFLGQDYVEKPFEIKDLKNRIDKVLENH